MTQPNNRIHMAHWLIAKIFSVLEITLNRIEIGFDCIFVQEIAFSSVFFPLFDWLLIKLKDKVFQNNHKNLDGTVQRQVLS